MGSYAADVEGPTRKERGKGLWQPLGYVQGRRHGRADDRDCHACS